MIHGNFEKYIKLSENNSVVSSYSYDMIDLVAINVETPRIDSGCSLERELIKLIHINS